MTAPADGAEAPTSQRAFGVRSARPEDYDAIAALTVAVYRDGGFSSDDYLEQLGDIGARAAATEVLVAVLGGDVVGSVALAAHGGPYAEQALAEEAVFRMLAVVPAARGRGAGEALVRECLRRAGAAALSQMVISTQPEMTAAHRLYERLGFVRRPERDWSPRPGVNLLTYTRALDLP